MLTLPSPAAEATPASSSPERLREFLHAVQEACGADRASVFAPDHPGWESAVLAHSGPTPAAAELSTLETAHLFARRHGADEPGAVHSVTPGALLVPVPLFASLRIEAAVLAERAGGAVRLARRTSDQIEDPGVTGWVALAFGERDAERPDAKSTLELAARLASLYLTLHDALADPLTGLPGRSVLRSLLQRDLTSARVESHPISLLMFNPDDLAQVNERYGRSVGDGVLREVVRRAHAALRRTDLLCRHGAATFGVSLHNTGQEAAHVVADKIRAALNDAPFLDERLHVPCSVGMACLTGEGLARVDAVELIARAEMALATARQSGGSQVCRWSEDGGDMAAPLDRLSLAFTGDQDRDYRNMGLLWDAVGLLATGESPDELASRVASQLRRTLAASSVALLEPVDGQLRISCGVERRPGDEREKPLDPRALSLTQQNAAEKAVGALTALWVPEADGQCASVVPLVADSVLIGVLLVSGVEHHLRLDESDLPFLQRFGALLGLAMERARRVDHQRRHQEQEKRRLVGELKDLRTSLRQARLVYVSRQMEEVIVTAHRVADTDATVLITGESGTGKEILAHTVHQMSSRRGRSLVVVDCGAIPSTLIESELFGHERGAFTGALTKSVGRLAQADGGTVLLDEIGELPLEVQSKLLRFVQEKQLMAVGSTVVRRVDVRVLAATNRELPHEVAQGRFRADLYHRLNVISLAIPPLRERPDDVLELARYFLSTLAPKYQKAVRRFTPDAEEALARYSWPGNVRELQNRIMRAVIMSTGDTLGPDALSLPVERTRATDPATVLSLATMSVRPSIGPDDTESVWSAFRVVLDAAVTAVLGSCGSTYPPLGRWLDDDLVLAAFGASDKVASRAAARLGLPETTFTRRLRRAETDVPLVRRLAEWNPVSEAVDRLVRSTPGQATGENLLDAAEAALLEAIARHLPTHGPAGAALLGTSLPTFRRRLATLQMVS